MPKDVDRYPPVFTLFPNLPAEIRLDIWKWTCVIPRVVDIWNRKLDELKETSRDLSVFRTYSRPPVLLQVSHESREVALLHYSLSFGTEVKVHYGKSMGTIKFPSRIYVNWESDIIAPFPCTATAKFELVMKNLASSTLPIQHLALSTSQAERSVGELAKIPFPYVETVMLYPDPGSSYETVVFDERRPSDFELKSIGGETLESVEKIYGIRNTRPRMTNKDRLFERKRKILEAFPKISTARHTLKGDIEKVVLWNGPDVQFKSLETKKRGWGWGDQVSSHGNMV